MSIFKKTSKDVAEKAGTILGDAMSQNAHAATAASVEGMQMFSKGVELIGNRGFDKAKGNLFEYIEAAKFNREAANIGSAAKAIPTEYLGDPHAVADILIKENGKVVREVQAKFTNKASDAVFDQAGGQNGHWGKYEGMARLVRKDSHYNEEGSLLDEAKKIAKARGDSRGINAKHFKDVELNLDDETRYGDVSSGGTTQEEVQRAYDDPKQFSKDFRHQQLAQDIKQTSTNMAIGAAVSTGMVSSITNFFEVYKNEKELEDALIDITKDTGKAAVKGAATGAISTGIRYEGYKVGSKLLTDSTAATVMAGAMIDGGVALYSYAKGEISGKQLQEELVNTTCKASATIYFTKAVTAVAGTANPFLPIAVYSTASYVVTCTREILKNAELNVAEYQRLTAILESSTETLKEYREHVRENMALAAENQRRVMDNMLQTFDYNLETGENYDKALMSIVNFANETGIALQHADFNEFQKAMESTDSFVLE